MNMYRFKSAFRIIAAFLGMVFPLVGIWLALSISGVEPTRPVSVAFVSQLGGVGFVLGVGFLVFAFLPRRMLGQYPMLRAYCIFILFLPLFATAYFIIAAQAWAYKALWLAVGAFSICCMLSLCSDKNA
jgi:hypothetical protein